MQPTTAQLMMGGLLKIKDTVVGHNSVTVLNVVIVVDNVEGFTQTPSKIVTTRGCGKAKDWIKMCMTGAKYTRTRRPTRPVMSKKQGIHAPENSKENQSDLYFDQLEINTLGTAGNTDGRVHRR